MERRKFVSAAALTAASYRRVLGANNRIQVGLIGSGGRGQQVWKEFLAQPVEPSAVCDVYQPNLEKGIAMTGGRARGFGDFRELLALKDIDAVVVATPDHWHALCTIHACKAGKDVYVEKPLSLTVEEGRHMVKAARKYDRVVQVGSQQRSGLHYWEAVDLLRAGKIGKIPHISANFVRNVMPGFGEPADQKPPSDLDYDMWLGPAPKVDYNPLRVLYHFRWFWDYSGGQMTNWGAHELDIARWAMNVKAPLTVAGFAGRYAIDDGGQTPDVQEVIYRFPEFLMTWGVREMNGKGRVGLEFHGTHGSLGINRRGFKITPETWGKDKQPMTSAMEVMGEEDSLTRLHVQNFLDCIKTRKRPNADVEEGHYSATVCHLGNIAARLNRALQWDWRNEQVIQDPEANKYLSRPYRDPWKLEV